MIRDYTTVMDGILEEHVTSDYVKGASALILHKGKEVYYGARGYADAEAKRPMKRDTIIRLYSMTKPITAAAVMLLVERGRLDVWDPVSKYLPEFGKQLVIGEGGMLEPARRVSTIKDLMNMTAGIPYPGQAHESGRQMDVIFRKLIARREQGERVDTREYLREIATVPLCFHPGDQWMYGLSADVLVGVIEGITGQSFGEFLRKEIFEPLEMPDTGFYVPLEKKERFARIYEWKEEKGRLEPFERSHIGEYYGEDVAYESGGAGLVSTLDDYVHFATMMIQKGQYKGRQLLGSKTVEFMTQNHLTKWQKRTLNWDSVIGHGYGCLMRVLEQPGVAGLNGSIGEYGWDGWAGNYVTMVPNEELVILSFIQRCSSGFNTMVRKQRAVTYGALEQL